MTTEVVEHLDKLIAKAVLDISLSSQLHTYTLTLSAAANAAYIRALLLGVPALAPTSGGSVEAADRSAKGYGLGEAVGVGGLVLIAPWNYI